jgi:Asp-tRNA(Asn)/Glu-tRNA(Gln) amidotransferase A subunit family amidase
MPLKKAELGTLDFASVGEAASVIRKRSIRSAELTQRMLDRIAKCNPRLNAVVNVIGDQAMDEARRRDAVRLGEGGPPHGVPILVKDAFEIAGVPIAGLPSTAAPIGRTPQGLPVGVQILGPNFEDAMSIDFAARMAEVAGGFMAPPGFE